MFLLHPFKTFISSSSTLSLSRTCSFLTTTTTTSSLLSSTSSSSAYFTTVSTPFSPLLSSIHPPPLPPPSFLFSSNLPQQKRFLNLGDAEEVKTYSELQAEDENRYASGSEEEEDMGEGPEGDYDMGDDDDGGLGFGEAGSGGPEDFLTDRGADFMGSLRMFEKMELTFTFQHLIKVGRHTKITPGGRVMSYSAFVLIGNQMGSAGLGYGKALSPLVALNNANKDAIKNVVTINMFEQRTIPVAEIKHKYRATKFHLRAAPVGHGRHAGGLLGLACDAFGFQDIFAKSYGSRNEHNVLRGFFEAVSRCESPEFVARATGKVLFYPKAIWRDRPYTHAF